MTGFRKPLVRTIIFGLAGAVIYYLWHNIVGPLNSRGNGCLWAIWILLVLYSWLLARWGQKKFLSAVYPLSLLLIPLVMADDPWIFPALCLGVLSWIRSGLYFQPGFRGLWLEAVMSVGGGALVSCLAPRTALGYALGIWMFFLVQSLYFPAISQRTDDFSEAETTVDRFEEARRRTEYILWS